MLKNFLKNNPFGIGYQQVYGVLSYMDPNLFVVLAEKYLDGTASADEREIVEGYWQLLIERPMDQLTPEIIRTIQADMRNNVFAKLGLAKDITPAIPYYKRTLFRYAVAAAVLFAVSTTYFLGFYNQHPVQPVIAKADIAAPVTNRAMITLGNGKTVYLDSAANGQLVAQGNLTLTKLKDGQIAYTGNSDKIEYNTLTNPAASKAIEMAFVDGSHVWLNAGSSVTFPVPFEAGSRRVTIKGEAYFEVAHNAANPFIVSNGETEIKVLGTHFNVNAYGNNPTLTVTLLEGSVQVSNKGSKQLLKPNQQATLKGADLQLIEDADTEQAMAWKNGKTSFHSADLGTVLREIQRWYDITVEIKGALPEKSFYADVNRDAPLSDILKVLDDNKVNYSFDASTKILVIKDK